MTTLKEQSQKDWTGHNTFEVINAGSLQRIATATEAMAKSYLEIQRQRDMYEDLYKGEMKRRHAIERQLSAAKGQITKLRKAALALWVKGETK